MLFGAVRLVVEWIRAVYSLRINGKLAIVGSTSFMWKVLHLPMAFFSQRMAGDIQQRQNANAAIAGSMVKVLAPLAIDAALMLFYLIVMFRYSVLLTLMGVASIVINLSLSRLIAKKRVNITRVQQRDEGKLAGATVAGHRDDRDHQVQRRGKRLFRAVGRLSGQREHAEGAL